MKIIMIAGFYDQVLKEIKQKFPDQCAERSIIWTPQIAIGREADAKHFNWAFFDRVSAGATEILVLLAVFRGREYIKDTLLAIAREGYVRFPHIDVHFSEFRNPKLHQPVIDRISAFGLPEPRVIIADESDLKRIEEWSRRELDGKILLHPRALRGARKSRFGEPSLVFEALRMLGNEYRDVRIEGWEKHGHALEDRRGKCGVEITEAVSPARAGEYGSEYYVYYPTGQLKSKELLSHHITKGTDRDERTCLRIYFFWDEDKKLVVVGWLPSHLDTRAT
jgi:hypothetical protein